MAREDDKELPARNKDQDPDRADEAQADQGTAQSAQPGADEEESGDGYKRTRRQVLREDGEPSGAKRRAGGKPGGAGARGKEGKEPARAEVPQSPFQRFMEEHWEGWLSQVLLILVAAGAVVGYKLDMLPESTLGMVMAGGVLAVAIYATALPAYDLIQNKLGRVLYIGLTIAWVAAVGYPTVRKVVPRKVLAQGELTEISKTTKLTVAEGNGGPYDLTVSASLEAGGSEQQATFTVKVVGENGQATEVSDSFSSKVLQARVRKGTNTWKEQHNFVEHRLPVSLRGKELTVSTEELDKLLQGGLHLALHPSSYDPQWFFLLGIGVVLGMLFVEARLGDAKTKTHLIMASASTLVFSYWFWKTSTPTRLVSPVLDSLLLAAVTGGIGGTLVGAVVRRASGRDRLKPLLDDETAESASKGA